MATKYFSKREALLSMKIKICIINLVARLQKELNLKVALSKENLLLRGCAIRNTDYIIGLVLYAGESDAIFLFY